MPNNLYNLLNGGNNMTDIVNQINQFKNTFKGDPRQQVESLVKSGQMSQAQFNQYAQTANQIMQAIQMMKQAITESVRLG